RLAAKRRLPEHCERAQDHCFRAENRGGSAEQQEKRLILRERRGEYACAQEERPERDHSHAAGEVNISTGEGNAAALGAGCGRWLHDLFPTVNRFTVAMAACGKV